MSAKQGYYLKRCSALVLLGLLIYVQTFQFGFVFDDHFFILDSPYIRSFGQIPLMWHVFPMTRLVGIYSFALNYYFNQFHPQGYHLFNFIVHLAAVALVWALAGLLFKITNYLPSKDRLTKELPFIIAVLFLVHPCQTQAVSYISQRFESMATVFYLGTIYAYLRARVSTDRTHKIILFGLSGLFAVLGILTKEVVITVPAMILASEWILFPQKINKKIYLLLCAGGVLLYLLFTKLLHADLSVFMKSIPSESHQGDVLTPSGYFLTQMRVFLTFLRLLVWPINQNLDYDYPASTGLLHPPLTLAGICVISIIIYLTIKLRRNLPLIAFGLAWVLVTFSINLAPRSNVIFEHKLYLISFGFFLATVVLLSELVRNRRVLGGILLCIITVLGFAGYERNKVWKNEFTIWNDAVHKSPHKARGYNNRGFTYYYQGDYRQAISDFDKAIEIKPDYEEAFYNRCLSYAKEGNFTQAFADCNKAIAIDPGDTAAYNDRGLVYYQEGNFTQAIFDFNKAIEISPEYAALYSYYSNRGLAYFKQGNFTQAMSDYNKAIEINPNFAESYSNRGLLYYTQGNFPQAIADYNKAIEINPHVADDFNNRGTCYARQGNLSQALSDYNKAVEINPDDAQALRNRDAANEQVGNPSKKY